MERDGYDYVDFIEEIAVSPFLRCQSSKGSADLRTVGVFHEVDESLDGVLFLIEEEGTGALEVCRFGGAYYLRGLVKNGHLRGVLLESCLFSTRKGFDTLVAYLSPFAVS